MEKEQGKGFESLVRTNSQRRSREQDRRQHTGWIKKGILGECLLLAILAIVALNRQSESVVGESTTTSNGNVTVSNRNTGRKILDIENDYIKWVDFTVSYEALCQAYEWDVETHGTEHEVDWVELLAYTAAKSGGEFDKNALKIMDKAAGKLSEGDETLEEMTADLKYYSYYKEAYDAAIGGLVGEYWEANTSGSAENTAVADRNNASAAEKRGYVKKYGLKGYFPLARGFDYTHYDDFGVGRSYGYQRKHLGHDMMGLVGTPNSIKNYIEIQPCYNS